MTIILEKGEDLRAQLPPPLLNVRLLLKKLDLHYTIILPPRLRYLLKQPYRPLQSLHPQRYLEFIIRQKGRRKQSLQFVLKLLQRSVNITEIVELIFDLIVPHLIQGSPRDHAPRSSGLPPRFPNLKRGLSFQRVQIGKDELQFRDLHLPLLDLPDLFVNRVDVYIETLLKS